MLYDRRFWVLAGVIAAGVNCIGLLVFLYLVAFDVNEGFGSGIVPVLMLASFSSFLIQMFFIDLTAKPKGKRKKQR